MLLAALLALPLASQADVSIGVNVPGLSLHIGDRDNRGHYWDGYRWRDPRWWADHHRYERPRGYYYGPPPRVIYYGPPPLTGATGRITACRHRHRRRPAITTVRARAGKRLQAHQLAKLFHLAAADRHFKLKIAQPQNVGIVEPGHDLADLRQVNAVRAVAAEKCSSGSRP